MASELPTSNFINETSLDGGASLDELAGDGATYEPELGYDTPSAGTLITLEPPELTGSEPQPELTTAVTEAQTATTNVEAVTNSDDYQDVRDLLLTNIADPTLPSGAIQTATDVTVKDNELVDPTAFSLEDQGAISVSTYNAAQVTLDSALVAQQAEIAALGYVTPATAAAYTSAEAQLVQVQTTAKAYVTQLAEAAAANTVEAEAAQVALDSIDPATTVQAVTYDIPNAATVAGQLDGLLSSLATGDIPVWAQPAVAAAEAAMAARGMSSSSVGKNSLYNAIINSALPIATADAAARLSVFQANVTNEQQAELANSSFFQTLTLTNLSNAQQTAILNATNAQNVEISNAQNMTSASIANAQAFLQIDLANLSNEQQTNILQAQIEQDTMLSNQGAENAALQFNAANQQQADQFNANLASSIAQFNATRADAMSVFNATEVNDANATQANMELSAAQFNAAATTDAAAANAAATNAMTQFNENLQFQRDSFNAQNATAIAQSNAVWRREVNTINTAAENAVNQANAMNEFSLSNQALTFLWQEQRDAASWANDATQNSEEMKTRIAIAALSNESLSDANTLEAITSLVTVGVDIFDNWGDDD